MKFIRILGIVLVSFLLLCYLLFLIVPPFVNLDNYKSEIQKLVKESTKLNLDYSKLKIYTTPMLSLGVVVKDAALTLDDGSTVLSTSRIKGGIALPSLLTLTVKTSKCYIDNPFINLEIADSKQYKIVSLIEQIINENISKPKNEEQENKYSNIIEKIRYKVPSILIKNYTVKAIDLKTSHDLSLKGDKLLLAYSPNNIIHINTIADLLSDNKENINANIDVSYELPKFEKSEEAADPDEKIHIPFVNIVDIYQKYDLHADVFAKLKVRKLKNSKQFIHGFLNVDNLNLKLEDIRLPDSYAHIRFTGRKVRYESDICSKDNEKISLMGMYNFANHPKLKAKIVSDKIHFANLLELACALLDSLNINHNLKQVKASGYLQANADIKTNFNSLKSEGFVIIENGSFVNPLYNIGIKDIKMNAVLDNNTLDFVDTQATINGSKLTLEGYVNNKSEADIKVDVDNLSLKELYNSFAPNDLKRAYTLLSAYLYAHINIQGQLNNYNAILKTRLSNLSLCDASKSMFIANKDANIDFNMSPEKIQGKFKDKSFSFSMPNMKTTALIDNLSINVDNNDITINPFELIYNKASKVRIYGDIENYLKNPEIGIYSDAEIQTSDLVQSLQDISYYFSHKGFIPVKTAIKGNLKKQEIITQIYADGQNYISPIVIEALENHPSIIQLIVDIKKDKIRIKDSGLFLKSAKGLSDVFDYNMQNTSQIADIKAIIDNGHINLFRLNVPNEIKGRIALFDKSKYSAKGKITMTGMVDNLSYGGDFKIENLDIPEILLKIKNIDMSMISQGFNLKLNDIDLNNSVIQASLKGDLHSTDVFRIYDVDINSNLIDVDKAMVVSDKLMKYMPPATSSSSSSDIPLYMSGKIDIKKLTTGNIKIDDIKSNIALEKNNFILKNLSCKAFEGKIFGDIIMNLVSNLLTVKVEGSNINLNDMITNAAGMKDMLSGTGSFKTDISFKNGDYKEQMKSLKGNISFHFKDGVYGPFSKLENFFLAQNVRENPIFKNTIGVILTPIMTIDSSHYDDLKGSLDFKNGIVYLDPITSTGDILCVLVLGNMDILQNNIDSKVRVRLASVVSDLLGPLAMANPINLVKNTPGLNIATAQLFSIFSAVVTEEEYNQIPDFSSNHKDANATKFQIILQGDVAKPLKLVKSFKWLALQKDMDAAKKFSEEFVKEQQELARQAEMKRLQEEYEKTHKTKTIVKKVLHVDNTAPAVKEMMQENK